MRKTTIREEVQSYLDIDIEVYFNNVKIDPSGSNAAIIRENALYMKDYDIDEGGDLRKIEFTLIRNYK